MNFYSRECLLFEKLTEWESSKIGRELDYHGIYYRLVYKKRLVSYHKVSLTTDFGYYIYVFKKDKKRSLTLVEDLIERIKTADISIQKLCHGCYADQIHTVVRKRRKISEYLAFGTIFYKCTKCEREWSVKK